MADWSRTFKAEYDYARSWLGNQDGYEEGWRPLVRRLSAFMAVDGFVAGEAACLGELRKKVTQGEKKALGHKKVTEDLGILQAVGASTGIGVTPIDAKAKARAACLKLLRHVYLLNRWGNSKVWVVSLPTAFVDWPSDDLHSRASTQLGARILLGSDGEKFSSQQKKFLAASTRESLAWCQKASMVLAEAAAASTSKKPSTRSLAARAMVKRWFADPSVSDADLDGYIATLSAGFKSMSATINKGSIVLTDWVPFRASTAQDEIDFLNAEAFTFASRHEGMDVVYIESNFFVNNAGNVLKGQKNWTRIVVHELTHLVCGTKDIVNGRARYAWYGIGPHAGYPGSQAVQNADNWAFFAADCAGQLTDSERKMALKIV